MAWVKFVVIVIAKAFCASILVFSWAKAFNGYRVSGGYKNGCTTTNNTFIGNLLFMPLSYVLYLLVMKIIKRKFLSSDNRAVSLITNNSLCNKVVDLSFDVLLIFFIWTHDT